MLFILGCGGVSLVASFYFALRAERRALGFIEGMGRATLFATLALTAADLGATLYATAREWDKPDGGVRMMVEGLAESTSPAIVGFAFLALVAMLTAVGRRRLDERSELG